MAGLRSRKEGDKALKPRSRALGNDWLSVVFEYGVSESLERQKVDARWWLENSKGEVGTVILVATSKKARQGACNQRQCSQPSEGMTRMMSHDAIDRYIPMVVVRVR